MMIRTALAVTAACAVILGAPAAATATADDFTVMKDCGSTRRTSR